MAEGRAEGKALFGYKPFYRLTKSIGTFNETDGEDPLRRFNSWLKNTFQLFVNLAKNDHDIDPVAERNLFMRGLSEDVRLRLENALLPRQVEEFTMTQLTDYTWTFFRRKYNVMVERVRLHRRKQETGESVQEYLTACT